MNPLFWIFICGVIDLSMDWELHAIVKNVARDTSNDTSLRDTKRIVFKDRNTLKLKF